MKTYKVTIKGGTTDHTALVRSEDSSNAILAAFYPFVTGQLPKPPDLITVECGLAKDGEVVDLRNN